MRTLKFLIGASTFLAAVIVALANPFSTSTISAQAPGAPGQAKRYRATRPLALDQQTGALRMPTQQEIDQTIGNLSTLTKATTNAPLQTVAGGTISLNLDGGFAGVMLARPNPDGTWETRCVFSLEEGAEFLGLVEDNQPR